MAKRLYDFETNEVKTPVRINFFNVEMIPYLNIMGPQMNLLVDKTFFEMLKKADYDVTEVGGTDPKYPTPEVKFELTLNEEGKITFKKEVNDPKHLIMHTAVEVKYVGEEREVVVSHGLSGLEGVLGADVSIPGEYTVTPVVKFIGRRELGAVMIEGLTPLEFTVEEEEEVGKEVEKVETTETPAEAKTEEAKPLTKKEKAALRKAEEEAAKKAEAEKTKEDGGNE